MEGPSSPLTPAFGFGLSKREGGKPDGRAEAAHRKGSGASRSWRPSAPGKQRSGWALGLAEWGAVVPWGVCVSVHARAREPACLGGAGVSAGEKSLKHTLVPGRVKVALSVPED